MILFSDLERAIAEETTIATTTWYPNPEGNANDKIRSELALNMIRRASDRGYGIVVVDGGSHYKLLNKFAALGVAIYDQEKTGMGVGRREAFREGLDFSNEVIVWTEPEKSNFIPELWKTIIPIAEERADLVIPDRRPLNSYPKVQQYAENAGNLAVSRLLNEYLGYEENLDLWSGPRIGTRKVFENCFLTYDGRYGDDWESIFVPVADAIIQGYKVIGFKINYTHPASQRKIEDARIDLDSRRTEQLYVLTNAIHARLKEHAQAA
ncbi:MAG: hypothetical protein ABIH37_02190 [archaeon]